MNTWIVRTMLVCLLGVGIGVPRATADVKILLPLERTAYQTNEWIHLSVQRRAENAVSPGELELRLIGEDGSKLAFTFAGTHCVEHLHLNGWLLRPGKYNVEATWDGATGRTTIELFSHIRRSSFRLVNWGARAMRAGRLPEGEDNLGYNLFMPTNDQEDDNLIRAGCDFMRVNVMGGGHQMDLRQECDWSDPLVFQGGTRRAVREAFRERTWPNALGVHFYDEPGLTWHSDPRTKQMTPHSIPSQLRAFESAFGRPLVDYKELNPKDPKQTEQWQRWAQWKLGFMDAAWKDARFGVTSVRPDFVAATQSQYGYFAFTDGYYFNVTRSLPIASGHGGYHDGGLWYFHPSMVLEFARARDRSRPSWYMPCWYGNTTSDEYRLEANLCFQTNIQGLMSPPEIDPWQPEKVKAAQAVVESNRLLGRLGTIFTTLPVTRPPVAVLFSLSQLIHEQTKDRDINYAHDTKHGRNVKLVYLAGKLLQHQFLPVLDEDVRDGTLAAHYKALILASINYLDAEVVQGIEAFIKQGGLVLLTADCPLSINGAVKLGATPFFSPEDKVQKMAPQALMREYLSVAGPLAEALRSQLEKAGIQPPFTSPEPGIVATRQAAGDIEYLFAVNATHDPQRDPKLGMKATSATLGFVDDHRPIYDAIHSGAVPGLARKGEQLQGQFLFGPGQMRVFARTAQPIAGVKIASPLLDRDYTRNEAPLRLDLNIAVLHNKGLLSGSVPLRIRVLDPLGAVRYDVHRATVGGVCRLSLPLAMNDPAGQWTVEAVELLGNTHDRISFALSALPSCNSIAGATRRAVYWADDRDRVFRFFRTHAQVTIIKGKGDYDAACQRIAKSLQPWNVQCAIVTAEEANNPRTLSAKEAATFIGLDYAARGAIKPGDKNDPRMVGFAVRGPAILLGTPEDNPLIKYLVEAKFLPFKPNKVDMPGSGRGLVAWQRDALGTNQESIALVGYDVDGVNEAIGSLYEMLAGIEPLTRYAMPKHGTIETAKKADRIPQLAVAWSVVLPDRVVGLRAEGDKVAVLTHARTLTELDSDGKLGKERLLDEKSYQSATKSLPAFPSTQQRDAIEKEVGPERLVKLVATADKHTAVAFWGGVVQVRDESGRLAAMHRLPQDATALMWSNGRLLAGDADGRVFALVLPQTNK